MGGGFSSQITFLSDLFTFPCPASSAQPASGPLRHGPASLAFYVRHAAKTQPARGSVKIVFYFDNASFHFLSVTTSFFYPTFSCIPLFCQLAFLLVFFPAPNSPILAKKHQSIYPPKKTHKSNQILIPQSWTLYPDAGKFPPPFVRCPTGPLCDRRGTGPG